MTSKRLRVGGGPSTNFDIDSVASSAAASKQLSNLNKHMKASPVFFIEPPPPLSVRVPPMEAFVKECHQCNKKFPDSAKIFMYSDCTFCSEECRAVQMEKDEKEAKQRDLTKKGINLVSN